MTKAIIITGVPGTGKTTIAKRLAKELGFKHIDLTAFAKSNKKYILEYDEVRQTYVVDEDRVLGDVEKLVLESDELYIIEGHFAHFFNPKLTIALFILYTDPNVLKSRLESRNYSLNKIFENIWAQNLDIVYEEARKVGHKNIIKVDSTDIDKAYNLIKKQVLEQLRSSK